MHMWFVLRSQYCCEVFIQQCCLLYRCVCVRAANFQNSVPQFVQDKWRLSCSLYVVLSSPFDYNTTLYCCCIFQEVSIILPDEAELDMAAEDEGGAEVSKGVTLRTLRTSG